MFDLGPWSCTGAPTPPPSPLLPSHLTGESVVQFSKLFSIVRGHKEVSGVGTRAELRVVKKLKLVGTPLKVNIWYLVDHFSVWSPDARGWWGGVLWGYVCPAPCL